MALIRSAPATVVAGLLLNMAFLALKFVVFLYSFVGLFFADAVDSFADCFVLLLLLVFLRFDWSKRITYATKDTLEAAQWAAIVMFRVVIVLDSINDLLAPQPRARPLLVIVVAAVCFVFGVVLAYLFVDEDDVVKVALHSGARRVARRVTARLFFWARGAAARSRSSSSTKTSETTAKR